MDDCIEAREAAAAFCRDGRACAIARLGEGNINDTFLVESGHGPFVLQKINERVFADPLRVIENFAVITRHLRGKQQGRGPCLRIPEPVPTLGGALCHRDPRGGFWRGQSYLTGLAAGDLSGAGRILRAGRALARFHSLAADLDVTLLVEPLPGFHHLPSYLAELDRVLGGKPRQLGEAGRGCLAAIDRLRPRATLLEEARRAGILAVQPIHGDPKLDNFIFFASGDDGLLDLDTVGGGLVHYDLGDGLRSCCNRAGEKGEDPSGVSFDLDYCRAFLQGYFSGGSMPGEAQRDLIYEAVHLIAFELGLRFFTDHLRGNTYFRVARDGENLARAVRQFRLAEDIAAKAQEIRRIIADAAARSGSRPERS